jgi:hypothetical protein
VVGREHAVQDAEHALLSTAPHVTRPTCTQVRYHTFNTIGIIQFDNIGINVPVLYGAEHTLPIA